MSAPRPAPPSYALDHIGPGAAALAVVAAALWGGNQVAIKVGLEGMPPLAMAAVRFAIGWSIVAAAALWTGRSVRLQAHEVRPILGLGVLFIVQIASLNIGTLHTSASRSTVLISAHPFFTVLFAHALIPGDRMSLRQLAGMVLAFAGLLAIFGEGLTGISAATLPGDAVVLFSAALLGLRQVVLKRLVAGSHPYKVLFWQALLSLPVFVAGSLLLEDAADFTWSRAAALGVLYQGVIVAGVCFIIIVFLLQRHSAGRIGVFSFLTPVVGVALSAWITGDELTAGLLAGTGLVAVGVTVSQTGARPVAATTPPAAPPPPG